MACFETRPPEQVFVLLCQSNIIIKKIFECQLSIIIVNCFHVFVNEIPTLRAHIHWIPALEGHQMCICLQIK